MGYGKFLFMLNNLFTIQRWNNRPSVIKFSEADNAFSTIFLSFVLNEITENDVENSLKWRLSRVLPKLVLSDISLELKERVERFSPDVWKIVRKKAFQDLYKVVDKTFIEKITDAIPTTIDKYADITISLNEAKINGKLFDYEKPILELSEKLSSLNLENSDLFSRISRIIFSVLLNLISMIRWNRIHRNIRSTVAGHSFVVVTISYLIATLMKLDKNLRKEVIIKALLHDLPEAFTGDVITPTKKKTPELDRLVALVEKEMFIDWIENNPDIVILKNYVEHAVNPFEKESGRIVRVADYIAALLECAAEISSGNRTAIFKRSFFNFKSYIKRLSPLDISDWIDEIESLVL
ncbi:HD domain-containing protein [Thermosipho ferrireducens]|uniref:HD domain-containing protein n=1 Tax=Thermosipho ferrireducens TaxID=2571116 RepID=A0ABX7S8N9_9BACT|nr:YfbR-like 5'-deoxynucleotidase [Thermosipho ferrireducens]QTA38155.1 HD domain-containing protein [Thermosipho ferrireducens]